MTSIYLVTDDVARWALQDPSGMEVVAVDYLMPSGYVLQRHLWARTVITSANRRGANQFHAAKCRTAEFYFEVLQPRASTHGALVLLCH